MLADPIAAQVKFPFVLFAVTREDGDLRICGFEGGKKRQRRLVKLTMRGVTRYAHL